ncbi:MAG: hypothetical protein KDC44_17925, partial [Phaeodactylibacter sp.]|nr:hypothetical protein [Phaeodactylibacter sp.]
AGTSIEVQWTITNSGLIATPFANWTDAVYLSTDETWDYGDTFVGTAPFPQVLAGGQSGNNSLSFQLPPCAEGNYYLIVRTDRWNSLPEADETNNLGLSSTQLEILPAPLPDLVAFGDPILNVAGFAQAGESYDLNVQVQNQGEVATTGSFLLRIFADTADFYNPASAVTVGNATVTEPLTAGAITSLDPIQVTLPGYLPSGTYYLHVLIDFTDYIEECIFDGNNTASTAAFELLEIPRPDLEIQSFSLTTDVASNKEFVVVNYVLFNSEAPFSSASLSDRIYLYDAPDALLPILVKTNSAPASIGNLGSLSRAVEIPIPDHYTGPLYARVRTNWNESLDETNFANNSSQLDSLQVISPNLAPERLAVLSSLTAGANFSMTWKDRNLGPGNLLNSYFTDRVYLSEDAILNPADDLFLGSTGQSATIYAGQALPHLENFTIPAGTAAGNYYLFVRSNSNQSAYENGMNADNEAVVGPIPIAAGNYPDLIALEISATETAYAAGTPMSFDYSVTNLGDAGALGNWVDWIYRCTCASWDPGEAVLMAAVPHSQVLPVGESYANSATVSLSYYLPEGNYYLYLYTDAGNNLYESNESVTSNIQRSAAPFHVTGYNFDQVDLDLKNVIPPCDVVPGEVATVAYTTKNEGSAATVAGSWYDGIVLSLDAIWNPTEDTLIVAQWLYNGNLQPGQEYAALKNFTLPTDLSGTYYVFLVTDLFQVNNETALSNNAMLLPQIDCTTGGSDDPITFQPKPDLQVEFISAPGVGTAGQPLVVQYRVTNIGTNPAPMGNWTERLFLGLDTEVQGANALGAQAAPVSSLAPGESYIATLTVNLPINASGNYFLLLETDTYDFLAEESESNNVAAKYLLIEQPLPADLIVQSVSMAALDTVSTDMTVSWVLQNVGNHLAQGQFHQSVYLSSDAVWDNEDFLLGSDAFALSLEPGQTSGYSLTGRIEFVRQGDFFVIIRTDIQNNIVEQNDANNDLASAGTVYITVPEIIVEGPVVVATADPERPLFYRIEIPPGLTGEAMRVRLQGFDPLAFNELYLSFNTVPNRTVYDFAFDLPFVPDQEVLVPELEPGTYYVMAYVVEGVPDQTITLQAELVPFELTGIQANAGGNTGQMTAKITGGKFVEGMSVWLDDGAGGTIFADNILLVDATEAYVTFDLLDAPLGLYDVRAMRSIPITEEALLADAFTVVAGSVGNEVDPLVADCMLDMGGPNIINLNIEDEDLVLDLEKLHPPAVRNGQTVAVTLRYHNMANIDVPIPQRLLSSGGVSPLSLDQEDFASLLQELSVSFPFDAGSATLPFIPPGGVVSRTFYVKAQGNIGDVVQIAILKL